MPGRAHKTVGDPPGLRLGPLLEFFADWVDGFVAGEDVSCELLQGGRSNVTYRVGQGHRSWVVRRPPLGHVMASAHDMTREFRVLSALSSTAFPVPVPLALCETEDVIGAPFIIMEFVPGRSIADAADASRLSVAEAAHLSRLMVRTLADLHVLDISLLPVSTLGRPAGYLKRQASRWNAQWLATKTRDLADAEALSGWLAGAVGRLPELPPVGVVHGDYRVDNAIFTADLSDVRAVLDWEMCTLGDPVLDLATMLVYWSRPGEELRHQVPVAMGVTDGLGFWDRRQIVEEYVRCTGFDIERLDVCVALACFKLGTIMESIHRRTLMGAQLGRAEAGGMAEAAPALMTLGLCVARGGFDALAT